MIIVILHHDYFCLIIKHPSLFQWPFLVRKCPYALISMTLGSILGYTYYLCVFLFRVSVLHTYESPGSDIVAAALLLRAAHDLNTV